MGTNVKIKNFGTHPVTSKSVNRKIYLQHFFKHDCTTKILIYFFSKIKTVGGRLFLTKIYTIFITVQFGIFVHITNSSFCHVLVTNLALVTFHSLGIINNSSAHVHILSNITIFGE